MSGSPSGGLVFSSDEEVDALVGPQHLAGALHPGDGRQLVGVVAGVEGGAGPAGALAPAPRRQHVAHLAVEVGEGGQSIEDQVLDAFDGVP